MLRVCGWRAACIPWGPPLGVGQLGWLDPPRVEDRLQRRNSPRDLVDNFTILGYVFSVYLMFSQITREKCVLVFHISILQPTYTN